MWRKQSWFAEFSPFLLLKKTLKSNSAPSFRIKMEEKETIPSFWRRLYWWADPLWTWGPAVSQDCWPGSCSAIGPKKRKEIRNGEPQYMNSHLCLSSFLHLWARSSMVNLHWQQALFWLCGRTWFPQRVCARFRWTVNLINTFASSNCFW